MAWFYGLMTRMDPKKFPKRPEQMWENVPDQSVEQMIAIAKMWARDSEIAERRAARIQERKK